MDWVGSLAVSVVGGGVAALITVWLSLRQFYQQRWWERKLDAYTAIVDALHHMKNAADADYWEELDVEKLSPEERAKVNAKYAEAKAEILRLTDMGELIFSAEAIAELRLLFKKMAARQESYYEHLENSLAAVNDCLDRFKPIAKRDLELTRTWLPWQRKN